ncbi:MAG: hypothetical protein RL685_5252 [Pseudomonadota bacterium]|jgi:outer membrane protein TolC
MAARALTLFCIPLLLASLAPAGAAEVLGRGPAIARALAQNPQIAAAHAVEAQAQARQARARAARLPSVTMTAALGPALKAKLAPGTAVGSTESAYGDYDGSDLSLVVGGRVDVLQPLYTFGKIGERLRATELEIRARQAQTDMTRAEVAVTVARLYESLLLARDAGRFLDDTERWLVRSLESAGVEEGAAEDELRLKAALGIVQLGRHQAAAGWAQAQAGMVAFLAYPEGTQLEPAEAALELLPMPSDGERALSQLGLRERPELRALAQGSAAFDALAAAEQADAWPDFFALGFLSGAYTPGRDLIESRFVRDELNHFVPGILVGARWVPLGSQASERAAETRARAAELRHAREWAALAIPAEITKAYEDLRRARQDADDADRAAVAAKQWLVRASADFAVGLADGRGLNDAADAFGRLRLAALDARFRHNVALAELARATGTLVGGTSTFYPTH